MTTEAEAISKLAASGMKAETIELKDGRVFVVMPRDHDLKEVSDEHGLKITSPKYIHQKVTVQTVDSLVEYVNKFKSADTALFADIDANAIRAVIDYHAPAKAAELAHRAILQLNFSQEWVAWTKISGKLMAQLEFARFIEENGTDIKAPNAGELLEAVRDLQAHRKVNFIKAVRTSTDNESFEYSDETKATTTKGGIELPTKFVLSIPVYFGESDVELHAFLRWAIDTDAGGLALGVALHRAEHVRQAVFQQIVVSAAERASCPAVFGKPE